MMEQIKSIFVEGSYSHELRIPESWEYARLDEVIKLEGGSQPPKSEFRFESGESLIRLIQIRDYKSDNHKVYIPKELARRFVDSNDVMIGRYGPPIFQILRGLNGAYNVALMKAVPVGNIFSNDYLFRYLSNEDLYNYVNSASDRTAGQSGVNKEHLEKYPVAVPPLAEQQQIAAKLDELLAQVDNLKTRLDTIPKIIKRFRQSVLASAVSGKLTEDWREKFDFEVTVNLYNEKIKEDEFKVKANNLRVISPLSERSSWLSLQFGHLFNVKSGSGLIAKDMVTDGNIPVYGGNGINGYHDQNNITEETIVIGRVGFYCGSVHLTKNISWVTDNALIVSFPKSLITKDFSYLLLRATNLRVDSASTAQPVISGTKIYPIEITLPPIEEQTEIVTRIEQLFTYAEQIEQRVKDAQARVNHLTQAILAKAFSGELTADWRAQNPELISDDNSAAALLARIKAERETVAKPKKTGKKAQA